MENNNQENIDMSFIENEEDLKKAYNAYMRMYRNKNKDKFNANRREAYAEDIEKSREYKREWYRANSEEINKKRKEYREANIDKVREQKREWARAYRAKLKAAKEGK